MKRISLIPYIGGKYHLIDDLVPVIKWSEEHYKLNGYLEVCGGGARMLLNLPPTLFQYRLYNDLDVGLCKLFACLQSPKLTSHMIKLLLDLEYTEDNFNMAKSLRNKPDIDMVTAAAYTFLVAHQSRAGFMHSFEHLNSKEKDVVQAHYRSKVHNLRSFHSILGGVDVTNADALDILKKVSGRSKLFVYIDTPYPSDSKISKRKSYEHENFDYERLVNILLNTKLKVMLSGYAENNRYYDRLSEQNGWHKIFVKNLFVASSAKAGTTADEYIWINFDIPEHVLKNTAS